MTKKAVGGGNVVLEESLVDTLDCQRDHVSPRAHQAGTSSGGPNVGAVAALL